MQFEVQYDGNLRCSSKHLPSGKIVTTDAPADKGGSDAAHSPTDLVALALGCCILTLLGMMAKRHTWDICGTRCTIDKEMTSIPVRRIGSLKATIVFPQGFDLPAEERAKLESAVRACPVKQSLHPDIELATEFVYS